MDLLTKVKALEQAHKSKGKLEDKPRHYAVRIMQLKTKEERKAALERVPEGIRHIVHFYIMDAWARRTGNKLPNLENNHER